MSLILAIPCADRIVVAADGRAIKYEDNSHLPDKLKIFELTHNSVVLIAGNGLIDKIDNYMNELVATVKSIGNSNIVDIARDVKEIIDIREWAEWKDRFEESHMEALVAGYDGGRPDVYCILDTRQFTRCWAGVFGNWDKKEQYMLNNLSTEYTENTKKIGNKVAIEMLSKARKANPKEVGKPYSIWHILPDKIIKLKESDIRSLDERYNGKK